MVSFFEFWNTPYHLDHAVVHAAQLGLAYFLLLDGNAKVIAARLFIVHYLVVLSS
jgi:hypothetical protein